MSFKVYSKTEGAKKPTMRMFDEADQAQQHAANEIAEGKHVVVTSLREVVIFDNASNVEAAQ